LRSFSDDHRPLRAIIRYLKTNWRVVTYLPRAVAHTMRQAAASVERVALVVVIIEDTALKANAPD